MRTQIRESSDTNLAGWILNLLYSHSYSFILSKKLWAIDVAIVIVNTSYSTLELFQALILQLYWQAISSNFSLKPSRSIRYTNKCLRWNSMNSCIAYSCCKLRFWDTRSIFQWNEMKLIMKAAKPKGLGFSAQWVEHIELKFIIGLLAIFQHVISQHVAFCSHFDRCFRRSHGFEKWIRCCSLSCMIECQHEVTHRYKLHIEL